MKRWQKWQIIRKTSQRVLKTLAVGALCFQWSGMWKSARADDVTNRELAKTFANFYLRQHDYPKMLEILSDHLEQDPEDSEAWNLLGLGSLEMKALPQAKHAFYMASTQEKGENRGIYLYHYADALVLAGELDKARDTLKIAQQYYPVASASKNAAKNLKAGEALPPVSLALPGKLYGNLTVATAYDSNVILAPDQTAQILRPSDMASPTLTGIVSGGYLKPDGLYDWDLSSMAMFAYQTNPAAQSFDTLYGMFKVDRRRKIDEAKGWFYSFGNRVDVSFLNTSGLQLFNWNENLYGSAIWRHDRDTETEFSLPLAYRSFTPIFSSAAADDRTGPVLGVAATHRKNFGTWQGSIGVRFELAETKGANFLSNTYTVPLVYSRLLPWWDLKGQARLEYSHVSYVTNPVSRMDDYFRLSLLTSRRFGQRINGAFDLTLLRNASSLPAAQFSKFVATVMVTYDL